MKQQSGKCKLCGKEGPLTYEHVPPRNAHNKGRFAVFPSDAGINDPFLEKSKGRTVQGGIGYYALCESCNNNTGGWYGKSYIDFVNQGVYRLRMANIHYADASPFIIHPLKVIKQVVSFFVTIGVINYAEHHPDLTQFVLNKRQNTLPENYQLYMYYNDSGRYRYIADNTVYNSGVIHTYSEIAHFPFGFVLSLKNVGVPIDRRHVEITSWKNYSFDAKDRLMALPLQALPVEVALFPGDYRSRKEIENAIDSAEQDLDDDGENI